MPKPRIIDPRPPEMQETSADVAEFAGLCAEELLYWSQRRGECGDYVVMQ